MSTEQNKPVADQGCPTYKGRIMYPPRPKLSIPPEKIVDYENKGYVAQLKFNGTRTLVELKPGGEIKLWTRHREPHKAYKLSKGMEENLHEMHESMSPDKHLVIDGELMHSKTKGLKDRFIAFDILVCNDDYLIGMPMLERYSILDEMLGQQEYWEEDTGRKIAIYIRDHLWLAETFVHNLSKKFKQFIDMDEIEGLVLKKPSAPLERGHSENNNSSWLIRCRKPHKNYQF